MTSPFLSEVEPGGWDAGHTRAAPSDEARSGVRRTQLAPDLSTADDRARADDRRSTTGMNKWTSMAFNKLNGDPSPDGTSALLND
jgi:hypothetical protein